MGGNRHYDNQCDQTEGSAQRYFPAITGSSWRPIEVVLIKAFLCSVDQLG